MRIPSSLIRFMFSSASSVPHCNSHFCFLLYCSPTPTSAFTHTRIHCTCATQTHPPSLDRSQTRTASPALPVSACQTARRTSWTVSSRWSWPGRRPCPSGGRAPCRPGWRLSWRCPCTSAAAQRTSRAERSGSGRLTCAAPPLLLQLKLWRFAGFTRADRRRPGAGFRCQQPNASPKTPVGHRGLQRR